jgi:adenosylcobinamide-phosphate guanylyltransferase
MAGGRGKRFKAGEKPLARFRGRPLVEYILRALEQARSIRRIYVVTSPWTRKTEEALRGNYRILRAPGAGYVEDMRYALRALGLGRTLVIAADLPLLRPEDIDYVVSKYAEQGRAAMTVMVPLKLYGKLGLTPSMVFDDLVPAGVNVVDGGDLNAPEGVLVLDNPRFAFNVNTLKDLNRKAFI